MPQDAPVMATRRNSAAGTDNPANAAILTTFDAAKSDPINPPWAGQGADFPAFPLAMPSKVSPDAIRVAQGVARNNFSPIAHRNPLSGLEPAKSVVPSHKPGSIPTGRRGTGGSYTIPNPLSAPTWPTSSQWLRNRSLNGIPQ